jgi:hypothetical protein
MLNTGQLVVDMERGLILVQEQVMQVEMADQAVELAAEEIL